jgi:hypothetical protein
MPTVLYHIKCSQTIAMTKVRAMCENYGIENYIFGGGIHLYLTPDQIRQAKDIALTVSSELEIGMLKSAKDAVNTVMRKAIREYRGSEIV